MEEGLQSLTSTVFSQLLKERGALKAPVPRDPEEAGGEEPAKVMQTCCLHCRQYRTYHLATKTLRAFIMLVTLPGVLQVFAKKSSAPSVFNSVIQKLEQQYMVSGPWKI